MYPVEPSIISGISRPAQRLISWPRRRAGMVRQGTAAFGSGGDGGESLCWAGRVGGGLDYSEVADMALQPLYCCRGAFSSCGFEMEVGLLSGSKAPGSLAAPRLRHQVSTPTSGNQATHHNTRTSDYSGESDCVISSVGASRLETGFDVAHRDPCDVDALATRGAGCGSLMCSIV
jgi:hypothetical protein